MVHPLGKRPLSWFGPDDYIEGDDPMIEAAKRYQEQDDWDDIYYRMPLWKRMLSIFVGEYTESSNRPVNQVTAQVEKEKSMKNQELLHRRGSRLNTFTRALRDACIDQGEVLVKLRNGDMCKVTFIAADANNEEFEHPYDDGHDGGFRGVGNYSYWQANGESISSDRMDIVEFDPIIKPVAAAGDAPA